MGHLGNVCGKVMNIPFHSSTFLEDESLWEEHSLGLDDLDIVQKLRYLWGIVSP